MERGEGKERVEREKREKEREKNGERKKSMCQYACIMIGVVERWYKTLTRRKGESNS